MTSIAAPVQVETTSVSFGVPTEAPKPTVKSLINDVAKEYGISSSTLYNLVENESQFNPDAVGDKGCSLGLTQQNICANPDITKEQALNVEWSLRKAAKDIKDGNEYKYMVCNCWGYIKANYVKNLPRTKDLVPNLSSPKAGAVAIYKYPSGINHYAYVTSVDLEAHSYKEIGANLKGCDITRRTVDFDNKYLQGFWAL